MRQLRRAIRQHETHGAVGQGARQFFQQVVRERVNPVQVFDDDQQGFILRRRAQTIFQQRPQRALAIFRFERFGKIIVRDFEIQHDAQERQRFHPFGRAVFNFAFE